MGKRRDYDEDDVRVRPGRSTRPRTRIRPRHEEAVEAMVTEVHLGRYVCVVERPGGGSGSGAVAVTAMRARELGRRSVVVGDRVWLVGDVSGDPDSLARIVRITQRRSQLRRTADDGEEGRAEKVVVANADQLVIVSALADPPPRTGFIDRCLVAAYAADIDPLLCLTKADLVGADLGRADLGRADLGRADLGRADLVEAGIPPGAPAPASLATVREYYAELALPYLLCRPDRPLDELTAALRGRTSVLVGHSGVGKSTLVNRLVPDAARAVGAVSAIGKGRHTSSSAVALRLPAGEGWIVDTPGIRSFGLAHVSADSLLHAFADLVEGSADCPPGCDHLGPGCALDAWTAAGHADPRRLASYRRLLASRAS